MRNAFDFTPYRRSLIGFDSMLDLLENTDLFTPVDAFPPYDIEQADDDAYRIRVAVAGYSQDDIEITSHNDELIISGRRPEQKDRKFLHRGIATGQNFERRFQLAPHVHVTGASLADGMLEVDLKREVPEEAKPRKIAIGKAPERRRVAKPATEKRAPERVAEPQPA